MRFFEDFPFEGKKSRILWYTCHMLFNSYLFILLFLPLTLLGYYGLNRRNVRAGLLWLLAMSLWFYGYYNPVYLLLIGGSVLFNYICSRFLAKEGFAAKKALMILAVTANIALIFFFKYYDFFIGNINALFRTDFAFLHLALPLGISFFTLQQISFIVDSYRGKTREYRFLEYALFVTFFPQLVAGPIVLHEELIPQFADPERKKFSPENCAKGLMMFTRGLAKKVLIADFFAGAVDPVFAGTQGSSAEFILAMFAYTFQIYFDFSGYSDMAVGLGCMCNLTLPCNFDSPYQSLGIAEFWRRWHMTLGRFLTRYLYIPLGGSRGEKTSRVLLNTMIVFAVSGLWHGANFTFVLWGILHGLAVCADRLCARYTERLPALLRKCCTFLFVNFCWGLFRATSVSQFLVICKKLFTLSDLSVSEEFLATLRIPYLRYALTMLHIPYTDMAVFIFSAVLLFALALFIVWKCRNNYHATYRYDVRSLVATALLLYVCVISLGRVSVFLYFNF